MPVRGDQIVLTRHARRLLCAVVVLALFDRLVPAVVRRAEARRYESATASRFENSDLFALGPLVSYLREHPDRSRRRVVFFGNSIVYGYGLAASGSLPSQYQRLNPGATVYNMAINGFEIGSSYLVSKAILDSVDEFFVLVIGGKAHPALPSMIPVDEADRRAFGLERADAIDQRLGSVARHWRLYDLAYRFQAALFGTSTRNYIYLHKGDIVRRVMSSRPAAPPAYQMPSTDPPADRVRLHAPRSDHVPPDDRQRHWREQAGHDQVWKIGDLAARHRKRMVLIQIAGYLPPQLSRDEMADFNAAFAPDAEVVEIAIPPALRFDGAHMTAGACAQVARLLADHEAGRVAAP